MAGEGVAIIGALGLAAIRARGWQPLALGAEPVDSPIAAAALPQGVVLVAFTVSDETAMHDTVRRLEEFFSSGDARCVVEDVMLAVKLVREAFAATEVSLSSILIVFS